MQNSTLPTARPAKALLSTTAIVLSVAMVAAAVSSVVVVKSCIDLPVRIVSAAAGGLGQAFQPKVTVNEAISFAVGALDRKFELKVGEREIDTIVERTRETTWIGLNVGTTVTKVKVLGNLAQYIVPLRELTEERAWEFVGNEHGGVLLVHVPSPVVDTKMVSVQTDPTKIEAEVDDQWLSNVFFWQGDGVDEAKHAIRGKVIEQASGNAYLREVEAEAAPRIEALLQSALQSALQPGVQVKVVWER